MADVRIRIRPNGPFVVEGPIELVDSDGNAFDINPDKPAIALCRCGASGNKPFCDGAHNKCDFSFDEKASDA
ncbi:MAG: CDGSH iron-sulfur domain-containing protein [Planctomycetota bacterium]